jgi:hypothetical protein
MKSHDPATSCGVTVCRDGGCLRRDSHTPQRAATGDNIRLGLRADRPTDFCAFFLTRNNNAFFTNLLSAVSCKKREGRTISFLHCGLPILVQVFEHASSSGSRPRRLARKQRSLFPDARTLHECGVGFSFHVAGCSKAAGPGPVPFLLLSRYGYVLLVLASYWQVTCSTLYSRLDGGWRDLVGSHFIYRLVRPALEERRRMGSTSICVLLLRMIFIFIFFSVLGRYVSGEEELL